MSFFSKLWKGVRKVAAPVIGGLIGGPVGAIAGRALAGSSAVSGGVSAAKQLAPIAKRVMPGAGAVAAGGLGALAGMQAGQNLRAGDKLTVMADGSTRVTKKRRRARGITASELKAFDRVSRFVDKKFKCTKSTRVARR